MRTRFLSGLFFVLALGICNSAGFAWINTGHKVVALVAWEDLTPKTKAAVTAILKQHPRYEKDLLLNAPADESVDEQARTAFATAATWPDMVRNKNNPMSYTHNHPAWHYIDIPYSIDGQKVTERPVEGSGPHNIVEALKQCAEELKDTKKSDADKAIDICWVEHLVGDIHQPLHAISLYSPQFPDGDQGGNAEVVLRDPPYPDSSAKLHLIWDSLPGDFNVEELDRYEALGLRGDAHYSRAKMADLIKVTDFMAWANESHQLAIDDAYLNGSLHTGLAKTRRGAPTTEPTATPGVPPGYMDKAEHVAMHQVALAGYRLADQLNGIFDATSGDAK